MKNCILFLLTIVCIIYLNACCRQVQCSNSNQSIDRIGLIGFDSTDFDSVILIRYRAGSNFGIIDSQEKLDSTNSTLTIGNDTSYFDIYGAYLQIVPNGNYEVYIGATNATILIDQVLEPQTSEKNCSVGVPVKGCVNTITSIRVNTATQPFTTVIYIYK